MPSKALMNPAKDYQRLLVDIRKEMDRGINGVERLVERQKIISYWTIGQNINTYLAKHEQPHGAITKFYTDLSKDLNIHERTLQQSEQFYRYFPKVDTHDPLSWSHYRFLLAVPDPKEREEWIAKIKKEKISADKLRLALSPSTEPKPDDHTLMKEPIRGRLYTYHVLRANDLDHFDVPWFVDTGFACRRESPKCEGRIDNKYLYTSVKSDDSYRLVTVDAKVEELYTYRARLRRVIDADTFVMLIDQGFSCWIEQRLRLFGVDAPEMSTLAGKRARQRVVDILNDTRELVVKTYKSDKWDRYLVDVFYLPGETDPAKIAAKGIWLNGKMVKEGIAKIWKPT